MTTTTDRLKQNISGFNSVTDTPQVFYLNNLFNHERWRNYLMWLEYPKETQWCFWLLLDFGFYNAYCPKSKQFVYCPMWGFLTENCSPLRQKGDGVTYNRRNIILGSILHQCIVLSCSYCWASLLSNACYSLPILIYIHGFKTHVKWQKPVFTNAA